MASQTLSPRQKMINMMYLVLTAILALNVSAEIMEAFELFRASLNASAQKTNTENGETAGFLQGHIEHEISQGNHRNEALIPMVNEIRSQAKELDGYLSTISKKLEEFGGVDEETGKIIMKEEKDKNYRFWLGNNDLASNGRGNGEATLLKDKLEQYIKWANEYIQKIDSRSPANSFASITGLNSDSTGGTEAGTVPKSWEYNTFHDKPVVADLAMVEKFRLDVRQVESKLLEKLKGRLGGAFIVDSLYAYAAPFSSIVPAGTYYEARIAIGMASKSIKPEFFGSGITVEPGGSTAIIKIPASAATIPSGQLSGIQRWSANVKLPNAEGKMQEFPVSGEFTVRKPEAVVKSVTMKSLYYKCSNVAEVDVPSLGDLYNPDYGGSQGGLVKKDPQNLKKVTIIPSAKTFTLSVNSLTNGQRIKIDDLKYEVLQPPKPRIVISQRGAEYNPRTDLLKKQPINIKIKPDEEFLGNFRRDAKYTSGKVKISLLTFVGPTTIKEIPINGQNLSEGMDVDIYVGRLKSETGTSKILIEFEGIIRINAEGEKIPDTRFTIYEKSVVISVK